MSRAPGWTSVRCALPLTSAASPRSLVSLRTYTADFYVPGERAKYVVLGGIPIRPVGGRAACNWRWPARRVFLTQLGSSLLPEVSLSTRPLLPLTSVPIQPSYPPNVDDTHTFSRNVIQHAGNLLLSYLVQRSVRFGR